MGPLATCDFFPKMVIRPLEVGRSVGHQMLKLHGGPALSLKVRANVVLPSTGALCGNNRGLKRDRL